MGQKMLETTVRKSRNGGALFGWLAKRLQLSERSPMQHCMFAVLLTSLAASGTAFISGMWYVAGDAAWAESAMEEFWYYASDFLAAALFLAAAALITIGLWKKIAGLLLAAAALFAFMLFMPWAWLFPISSAILCIQAFRQMRREKRNPAILQDRRYYWKALLAVYMAFAILAIAIFAWDAVSTPAPAGDLPEWLADDTGWATESQDETYPWEALEGLIAIYLPLAVLFAEPVLMGAAVLTNKRRWARLAVILTPIYVVLSNLIYGEWLWNLLGLALQPELYIGLYVLFGKDRGGVGNETQ